MRALLLAWTFVLVGSLFLPSRALAASCPDAIVGDPNASPSVQIGSLPQPDGASGTVTGTANNLRTGSVRISAWAHTDRYYPQPLLTAPFTPLAASVLVPSELDVTLPELFAYTFDGSEPLGNYVFFGLLTPPGAFGDGHVDNCELLFLSPASSTFSR